MKAGRAVAALLALAISAVPGVVVATEHPHAAAAPGHAAVELVSPASGLRVLLGRLLSEHAFLAMEAMRARATDRPDAEAAAAAVAANTADLTDAIALVYGDDAGAQFRELWDAHVGGLDEYARAVADDDTAARDQAHHTLDAERQEFAAWLAAANPNVTEGGVNDLLHLHIDQLTSYLEEDFDAAFVTERQAFHHMFETGDTLASAIISQFPDRFPGRAQGFSPAVSLWVSLDRLLGEHLVLAAEAMRAGQGGGAEFEAASNALNDNSSDLATSIASIYGEEAGTAFGDLWREHIDAYLAYIEALEADDQAAIDEHRDVLEGYAEQFGEFLAGANPYLAADSVASLIRHHTVALLEQVDAYAEGDYDLAYETVREAYAHMFDVGKALAVALAEQFPARFPVLPASTTEAAAPLPPNRALALLVGLLVLGVVLRLTTRQPRQLRGR